MPLRFKKITILLLAGIIVAGLVSTLYILPAAKKVSSEGQASPNPAGVQSGNIPGAASPSAPLFPGIASPPASPQTSDILKQLTPDQNVPVPPAITTPFSTAAGSNSVLSGTPASVSTVSPAAETTKESGNGFRIEQPQPLPLGPLVLVRLRPTPAEPDLLKRLAELEPVYSGRFQPLDYLSVKADIGASQEERLLAVINQADEATFAQGRFDYVRLDPDADTARYFVTTLPTSLPPNGENWLEDHWQILDKSGSRVIFKAELPLYAGTGFRASLQISKLPPRIYLPGVTVECPCPALAAATFNTPAPAPALSTRPSGKLPLSLQDLKTKAQSIDEKNLEKVVSQVGQNEVRGKGPLNTRYTDSPGSVYMAERLYLYFFALGLKVEYDSFLEGGFGTITSNVIAEQGQSQGQNSTGLTGQSGPGPSKPVWLVAHYDSLGERNLKGFSNPKIPAYGANDDGVGLAGLLEIARLLAPYQLKQPVTFIAFGAEEQGMLGSQHFAYYHTTTPAGNCALINIDSFGYNPGTEDWVVLGYGNNGEALKDSMLEYVKKYNLTLRLEVRGGEPFFRSDDFYFDQKGFSAVALTDTFSVQNPNNHTSNDTLDNVNFSTTRKVIQLALVTVAEQSESVQ